MCRLEFWRVAYLATRINKGKFEEKDSEPWLFDRLSLYY